MCCRSHLGELRPKFSGKVGSHISISKAPSNNGDVDIARAVAALWFDVVLNVKIVHIVELPAETTRWNDDVNVVRIFLLGARCFELAFVACHGFHRFGLVKMIVPGAGHGFLDTHFPALSR